MGNLYSVLGLSPGASGAAIKAAYYSLAKQCHPDRHAGETAQRRIRDINDAYQTLADPVARAAYDLILERQRSVAQTRFWKAVATAALTFALTLGSVPLLVLWQQNSRTPHQDAIEPASVGNKHVRQAERTDASTSQADLDHMDRETAPAADSRSSTALPPRDVREEPRSSAGQPPKASAEPGRAALLALGHDSQEMSRGLSAPQPSVAPLLLNPDFARPPSPRERNERLATWKQSLAKIREDSQSIGRPGSGVPARDYQALRKYVLGK